MTVATATLLLRPSSKVSAEGDISDTELARVSSRLYRVTVGDVILPVQDLAVESNEQNEVTFSLSYALSEQSDGPKVLGLYATHLDVLADGYTSAVQLTDLTAETQARTPLLGVKVLHSGDRALQVHLPTGRTTAEPTRASPSPETESRAFARFFVLGIEHMLTGYDHLLFLAGVVLGCTRLRRTLWLISGFTVAHSVTLAAAAFGWIVLPASLVEMLIAASIVYVGVENVFSSDPTKHRGKLTFAFGLIHGLGFATVLGGLGLDRAGQLVLSLFAFNLGLEVAQAAAALLALPLILCARSRRSGSQSLRVASLGVSAAGVFWLATRLAAWLAN